MERMHVWFAICSPYPLQQLVPAKQSGVMKYLMLTFQACSLHYFNYSILKFPFRASFQPTVDVFIFTSFSHFSLTSLSTIVRLCSILQIFEIFSLSPFLFNQILNHNIVRCDFLTIFLSFFPPRNIRESLLILSFQRQFKIRVNM